jgi:hypothetical protein
MSTAHTRRRLALAALMVPALLAACRPKEQAPPPATTQPPPSAPTTTTTTTTTIPSPPPVWRAASWGMTKDAVLKAFPGEAQKLAQPADFGPQSPGTTDVAIPAYEANGASFRVLFGFEGDALHRIQLSGIKPADTVCGDLEKQLTETHSAPSDRNTTQTNLKTNVIVWKRPDQTITLVCTEALRLGYRTVTLDYSVPAKI